ncbi:major facilitator superfamily domain-containing protein [Phascolomyces articulosus]|uniref:Major facilitator superfamily domain-containing protein n=1 Tax=Phascolomyces articulosus TaxID=60185 RepID=A0AAD5JUI7_9FUNG|nr:major facilitator superfamily domain-containing protein [Phascolomyces articulosus]
MGKNTNNSDKMEKRRPFLLKFRSSNTYVLLTASVSSLSGAIVYSVAIPILPFVINSMKQGISPQDPSLIAAYKSNDADISLDTYSDTGIVLGIYAAASVIAGPIFGYLGDKSKHRRTPMLLGIAALFLTTILFLFATQYWMLILARILQGISDACVFTLALALVSDTFPRDVLGTQMAKVITFQAVGLTAGSPIGVLFDKFGYKSPFIFCIVLVGIDFFLRLFLIERRNSPKHWFETTTPTTTLKNKCENEHPQGDEESRVNSNRKQQNVPSSLAPSHQEDGTTHSSIVDCVQQPHDTNTEISNNNNVEDDNDKNNLTLRQRLFNPRIIVSLLIGLIASFSTTTLHPTLPIHLKNEWGYNATQIGLITLAFGIPPFFSMPLSGYLYDRFGPRILCSIVLLLSGIVQPCMGIPSSHGGGNIASLVVMVVCSSFTLDMALAPVSTEFSNCIDDLFNNYSNNKKQKNNTQKQEEDDEEEEEGYFGRGYGILHSAFCLGEFLGPLMGGYIFRSIGFYWLCITVGIILIVSSPFPFLFLGNKRFSFSSICHSQKSS